MLAMILYLLIKKSAGGNKFLKTGLLRYLLISAITGIIILAAIKATSQQLIYKVLHNGDNIGWIKLERSCDSVNYCRMQLESKTSFSMILSFRSFIFETSYFLRGKLIFSSQYQKLNRSVKANKKTRFNGKGYEVIKDNSITALEINDVNFNLMCMYFQEPRDIKRVYCDKHETYADIEKTADGGYKVYFPDGNSNCYYYENGICSKVRMSHSLYTAEVILESQK